MQLVVTEDHIGVWAHLEGETPAEATKGERTSGPGVEQIRRLRELAQRLTYPPRIVRG